MSTAILTTKLYIPPVRTQLVPRPRLTTQLDESLARTPSIGLVCAPPGFGKTTLVSEWITQGETGEEPPSGNGKSNPAAKFAWVSLDEQDNDPVRFWSYVVAALDKIQTGVGTNAMALLHAPQSPPIQEILTTLINALADILHPVTLVLDDYHVVEQTAIHDAFAFMLDHLPPQLHLIIISRTDPPLSLTRFRVRNQLTELRDHDLRFTPIEAATFLNQIMGLNLSGDDVVALEARTEGWIAGLQLAAISMQGRDDVHGFVEAFTGSHRYVLDYLAEEVLSRQPEPIREFLLKTSILERLHGPLCDAVVGKSAHGDQDLIAELQSPLTNLQLPTSELQGQTLLEYLEQAHLFIIPLDDQRRWYRYHHLFADVLREQLRQTVDEASINKLHLQASLWYAQNDFTLEAINHALAANNVDRSVALIEQNSVKMLTYGEATTVFNWLGHLPQAVVRTRPRLSLSLAWANLILDYFDQIEPALQDAERGLAELQANLSRQQTFSEADLRGMRGEAGAIRAMILANQGKLEEAISLSEQALVQLPPDEMIGRSILKANLGGGYAELGELSKATEALSDAIELAQKSNNLIIVLSASNNLAEIQLNQGRLSEAFAIHQNARQFIETSGFGQGQPGHPSFLAGRTYLGLAEILREQNKLEAALTHLNNGIELSQQGANLMGVMNVSQIIRARIQQALGNLDDALKTIQKAGEMASPQASIYHWVQAVQARLWLAQGNVSAAGQWAKRSDLLLNDELKYMDMPGEFATLIRVYVAQERFDEALALLNWMEEIEHRLDRKGRLLELSLLQALTFQAKGEPEQSVRPLQIILPVAEAGGYARLFLDEGPPINTLLRRLLTADIGSHKAYVQGLLQAYAAEQNQQPAPSPSPSIPTFTASAAASLIEPLSDREIEVLGLIAEGLSNQEIANRLVIAEGTVKKHIHNIFGKLDVRRRTQVVLRARELGLL